MVIVEAEVRLGARAEKSFPRHVRLCVPVEFASVLKQKPLVRNLRFALHLDRALPQADLKQVKEPTASLYQTPSEWRLGLAVPKRNETSAQRRNIIKRVWREAFRNCRPELKNYVPHHLVIRLAGPVCPPARLPRSSASRAGCSSASLKKICQQDAEILLRQMLDKLASQRLNQNPTSQTDHA